MVYLSEMHPDLGFLAPHSSRHRGSELYESFIGASPFPHVVIDDFMPPETLEMCLDEFPKSPGVGDAGFDRDQERLKVQFNPDTLGAKPRALFYSFNSRPFINIIENVTGIGGLIPDPYFLGAGFHEIFEGGHLSVHVDFNHHKPLNLERRVNVLIYLNKDWRTEYGGELELWARDMTSCVARILPKFNRCVIFSTTSDSYHGNPNPVASPFGRSRRSIALYYYTSTWNQFHREHTTRFRVRPGTHDRVDWNTKSRELMNDLVPPLMLRLLRARRPRT